MASAPATCVSRVASIALGFLLLQCSGSPGSTSGSGGDGGGCFPDNDGISGLPSTEYLVVNDTGFFFGGADAEPRSVIKTQNDSQVTLTLQNNGTKAHGFK